VQQHARLLLLLLLLLLAVFAVATAAAGGSTTARCCCCCCCCCCWDSKVFEWMPAMPADLWDVDPDKARGSNTKPAYTAAAAAADG
jgi:hypothetical protein